MQLKGPPDTSTPCRATQVLLRDGAMRRAQEPLRRLGTAMVIGTATIGGPDYLPDTIPTEVSHFADYEDLHVPESVMEQGAGLPGQGQLLELDTDNVIPAEFQVYLRSSLESPVGEFAAGLGEDDYDLDARLVPPPMEEYQVQVRFRFIGEESPRIWTDADLE